MRRMVGGLGTCLAIVITFAGMADTILPPPATALSTTRGSVAVSALLALSYSIDESAPCAIMVSASTRSGTPVTGATLSIQGGGLGVGDWTPLITGEQPVTKTPTLCTIPTPSSGSIDDIRFRLDARDVPCGAQGLNSPWTYLLTYTIVAS